jgi:dUTP pyrophosphatase
MIRIPYVGEAECKPTRGSEGAACWDLYAAEDAEILPFQAQRISLGIKYELPPNYVLLLLSRSGLSFKQQIILCNSVGVLDSDYRGLVQLAVEWLPDPVKVMKVEAYIENALLTTLRLQYREDAILRIKKHERIAQAMLLRVEDQEWLSSEEVAATLRGGGGFGSTGLGRL